MSLWGSVLRTLIRLVQLGLTGLEGWSSSPLKLPTTTIAVIELVGVTLTLILPWNQLHYLHGRGIPPGQQVVLTGCCGMRPGLA
jgi:hypothetical protein